MDTGVDKNGFSPTGQRSDSEWAKKGIRFWALEVNRCMRHTVRGSQNFQDLGSTHSVTRISLRTDCASGVEMFAIVRSGVKAP